LKTELIAPSGVLQSPSVSGTPCRSTARTTHLDGTCIRDYIHVTTWPTRTCWRCGTRTRRHRIYNLGSGTGFFVKQVIDHLPDHHRRESPAIRRRPAGV